jgi:hypothetical protein
MLRAWLGAWTPCWHSSLCARREAKKKAHHREMVGFKKPEGFCLAPRPGLEPGTYGLTVRTHKCVVLLIGVDRINENQRLTSNQLDG